MFRLTQKIAGNKLFAYLCASRVIVFKQMLKIVIYIIQLFIFFFLQVRNIWFKGKRMCFLDA